MSNLLSDNELNLKCIECNLPFKFSVVFKSHLRITHKAGIIGMPSVECSFCDKTFSSRRSRNFHYSQVHEFYSGCVGAKGSKKTPCPKCGKLIVWSI